MGDGLIAGPKGYEALGAFNRAERSTALDLLGFDAQLVFATFSPATPVRPEARARRGRSPPPPPTTGPWPPSAPTTSASSAWAPPPLDDPDAAVAELDNIIELGLGAVWIPHRSAGGRSPGHDALDPFWAKLADAGIPAVLHVGGAPLQIDKDYMNTGRAGAHRLARRRRERPRQGHDRPPPRRRDVPRRDGARRRARAPPRPAGRRHRAGRRLGARPCSAASTTSPTSGAGRSPSWPPSPARRRSRSASRWRSRPTRSRTWAR